MLRWLYRTILKIVMLVKNCFLEYQAKISFFLLNKEKKKFVKENIQFKDKYRGKRCFVVGNGPSLNKQDLSLLEKEIVFTVNELMRDERYTMLKSDFHVFADEAYYKDGNEEGIRKLISKLEKEEKRPVVFFPIQGKGVIDSLKFKNIEFHYFFSGCNMYEPYNKRFDYTKSIPGFYTVVQYAITLAIYMGFAEIYLLGCDMTGYRSIEAKILGEGKEEHCYKLTEEERGEINVEREGICEAFFAGYAQMFKDYRRLLVYSNKYGIKLVNVTEGGILDSIPRKKYEEIVSKEGKNK